MADSPSLGTILDQAMLLPAQEQRRLTEAMMAITGLSGPDSSNLDVAETHEIDVHDWLRSIGEKTPWQRLQLIQSSFTGDLPEADESALQAAKRALLADHPELAARNSVRQLAADHPIAFVAGGLGLLLAIFAMGRTLLRLVF